MCGEQGSKGHNDEASDSIDGFHPVCLQQHQPGSDRRSVAGRKWSLILMHLYLDWHVTSQTCLLNYQRFMANICSVLLIACQELHTSPQLSAVYVTKPFQNLPVYLLLLGLNPEKQQFIFPRQDGGNWILVCGDDTSQYLFPDLRIHVSRNGLWKSPS